MGNAKKKHGNKPPGNKPPERPQLVSIPQPVNNEPQAEQTITQPERPQCENKQPESQQPIIKKYTAGVPGVVGGLAFLTGVGFVAGGELAKTIDSTALDKENATTMEGESVESQSKKHQKDPKRAAILFGSGALVGAGVIPGIVGIKEVGSWIKRGRERELALKAKRSTKDLTL